MTEQEIALQLSTLAVGRGDAMTRALKNGRDLQIVAYKLENGPQGEVLWIKAVFSNGTIMQQARVASKRHSIIAGNWSRIGIAQSRVKQERFLTEHAEAGWQFAVAPVKVSRDTRWF